MTSRKQITYLVQVALPFLVLGYLKHNAFYIPGVLILLSLPVPFLRRSIIQRWQDLGHFLGRFMAPLVLTVLYYGVLTPLACMRRLFGSDELSLKKPQQSTLHRVNSVHSLDKFDDLW